MVRWEHTHQDRLSSEGEPRDSYLYGRPLMDLYNSHSGGVFDPISTVEFPLSAPTVGGYRSSSKRRSEYLDWLIKLRCNISGSWNWAIIRELKITSSFWAKEENNIAILFIHTYV